LSDTFENFSSVATHIETSCIFWFKYNQPRWLDENLATALEMTEKGRKKDRQLEHRREFETNLDGTRQKYSERETDEQ